MKRINRIRRPVKRQGAERYLLITLLSFAASVAVTRMFLQLTGYPKLGSGGLHIAHVLWGGLFLFAASLLPLILANRWAYHISALLAGVGMGLFIDEVGKFITQNNDYFYPPAAPIIYAFFLITVLIYLQVRRPPSREPRSELYHALDAIEEVLDRDLDVQERNDLESRLSFITNQADKYPELASLANELRQFLRSQHLVIIPDQLSLFEARQANIKVWLSRHINRARMRFAIIIGLFACGTIALINWFILFLKSLGPESLHKSLIEMATASSISSPTGLEWFVARLLIEGLIGVSLIVGSVFTIVKQVRLGMTLGYYGLLLSLTTVDLLLFYFDQFSTILLALLQLAVVMGIIYYRKRSA